MASKPRLYRVTVEGRGSFPTDMLRYDRATPETESDSGEIERTALAWHATHTVKVIMPNPPTIGRWNSFGWRVVDTEGV